MGIKYNKPTENDEKTIGFKEALGIIAFNKKDVSKTSKKTTSIKNNIKN